MITGNRVVVVDYKFGEYADQRYHSQVRNYLKLIRQMGYDEVEGFLWYVELNKIEAVKGEGTEKGILLRFNPNL